MTYVRVGLEKLGWVNRQPPIEVETCGYVPFQTANALNEEGIFAVQTSSVCIADWYVFIDPVSEESTSFRITT